MIAQKPNPVFAPEHNSNVHEFRLLEISEISRNRWFQSFITTWYTHNVYDWTRKFFNN